MAALTFLPLDLKGNKPSNRIIGEQRTLVQVTNKPHRVLVPRMGAFYANNALKLQANGQVLVPGKDYTTTYLYSELSKLASIPIYALLVIINPDIPNQVVLDYQAVGGPFGLDVSELGALLDAISEDNFRVDFEDIVNKPLAYNPAEHEDEYWQLYGAENTLTVINRVARLAGLKDTSIKNSMVDYSNWYYDLAAARHQQERDQFTAHVRDKGNPHADTKATVGLGSVNNWPMATTVEHTNKEMANKYAQPEGSLHVLTIGPRAALNQHAADKNNPHRIRARDVNAPDLAEQNTALAQKLNKTDPAYNTAKIFGFTPPEFKTYVNKNLPASNITEGLFTNARLGSGTGNANTFLMGDGSWRSIANLVYEYDASAVRLQTLVIRTSQANTTAGAINYANAVFGNVAAYPVGSKAIFHAINSPSSDVGTQYEVKFLVRNTGGWASFIP